MSVIKFKLELTLVQILLFDNKPDIDIWQTRKTNDFLCVIYYIYCNQINANAFGENIIHRIFKKKQSYMYIPSTINTDFICNWLHVATYLLKFIYSEKATKFCEISIVDLPYVVTVKSTVEILQNFEAFSEYMNFTI